MERRAHWSWSIFDRSVGVFAAACAAAGAYFTYRAAYPTSPAPAPAPSSGAAMIAGAPWWALALIALSVILLVVSLTRSKRAMPITHDDQIADRLSKLEKQILLVDGYFKDLIEARQAGTNEGFKAVWEDLNTQRKSLFTPEHAKSLGEEIGGVQARLAKQIESLTNTAAAILGRVQKAEEDQQKLKSQMANHCGRPDDWKGGLTDIRKNAGGER